MVRHVGQGEIRDVASRIAGDAADGRSLVEGIVSWQGENLSDLWDQEHPLPYLEISDARYYRVSEYPHVYMRRSEDWWVTFFRWGKCEEYAVLFASLVEAAGFGDMRARVVHNLGIDHVWNDVLVGGRWMHVDTIKDDPVTGEQGIINDPGYYERQENGMGENLLFVYAVDEEGNPHDVTENYVENDKLSELTVRVERGGEPVSGARVTIKSLRRGKSARVPFRTDENGVCTFNLTENEDYEIVAESGGIGCYHRGGVTVRVENDNEVIISLTSSSFLPQWATELLVVAIVVLCLFLAVWKFFPPKHLSALLTASGSAISMTGLIGWKPLWIIFGSAALGFGLKGVASLANPKLKNDYLVASGILVAIAAVACTYAALVSYPADLSWSILWGATASMGFVSAYSALWKGRFRIAVLGALIMAAMGVVLLFPVRGFGFMPALSVTILSLSSAVLILIFGRERPLNPRRVGWPPGRKGRHRGRK